MGFEDKLHKLIEKEIDRRFQECLPDEMKVSIVGNHGKAGVFVHFVNYDQCALLSMSDCILRSLIFADDLKHQDDIALAVDHANAIRDDLQSCIEMLNARLDELAKLIE